MELINESIWVFCVTVLKWGNKKCLPQSIIARSLQRVLWLEEDFSRWVDPLGMYMDGHLTPFWSLGLPSVEGGWRRVVLKVLNACHLFLFPVRHFISSKFKGKWSVFHLKWVTPFYRFWCKREMKQRAYAVLFLQALAPTFFTRRKWSRLTNLEICDNKSNNEAFVRAKQHLRL